MNLDTIKGADDAELLNDPDIAAILGPRRRSKPLRFAQVRKLVEGLRMGTERHANIESYQGGEQDVWRTWRLRFSLRDGNGRAVRKSIVIEDALVARWVSDYLDAARKERPAYRLELREKGYRRRMESTFELSGSGLTSDSRHDNGSGCQAVAAADSDE